MDLEIKQLHMLIVGAKREEDFATSTFDKETVEICREVKEDAFALRNDLIRKVGFDESECADISLRELVLKTFDNVERKYSIHFAKKNAEYKKELDERMVKTEENEGKVKDLTVRLKEHKAEENKLREENEKLKAQMHKLKDELNKTRKQQGTCESIIGNMRIDEKGIENVGNLDFMSPTAVRSASSFSLQNGQDLDIVVEATNVRVMSAKSRHKMESARTLSGRTVRSQSVPSEGSQLSLSNGERTDRSNGVIVNNIYHIHHCEHLNFRNS